MRSLVLIVAIVLSGCSSPPEKKAEVAPPPAPVKDDRMLLVPEHQTSARVVPDHLLDKRALPGGTIGEYDGDGRKYQLFVIETASAQDAAILLLDLKTTLVDPAYIASMGGYFGTDSGKPVYVFAKNKYLAGVTGLAEDLADPIARQLAARLR
jgi:hypothetical protein